MRRAEYGCLGGWGEGGGSLRFFLGKHVWFRLHWLTTLNWNIILLLSDRLWKTLFLEQDVCGEYYILFCWLRYPNLVIWVTQNAPKKVAFQSDIRTHMLTHSSTECSPSHYISGWMTKPAAVPRPKRSLFAKSQQSVCLCLETANIRSFVRLFIYSFIRSIVIFKNDKKVK